MKTKRSTFAVLFYLNRTKIKRDGSCPVMGRITVDATPAQFSTGVYTDPGTWEAKAGRATGGGREAITVNKALDRLETSIRKYYEQYREQRGYVTAELLKNTIRGIGARAETFLTLFEEHNREYARRVGVDRTRHALAGYETLCKNVRTFIRKEYGKEDVPLIGLDKSFIEAFHLYLRSDLGFAAKTTQVRIAQVKKIGKRAVSQGTIPCDPFKNFHAERPDPVCRHLAAEELDRVFRARIDDRKLCFVRDMFVFATFTGMAYADMCAFSEKHLIIKEDGSHWICKKREKTGTEFNVKLLPVPLVILEKYRGERKGDKIFNMYSESLTHHYLRKLEVTCDVPRITFHMARHNFGTHITLSQGVPITTVCKMMGHKSILTTQIYAKILGTKVNEDMQKLRQRLGSKYSDYGKNVPRTAGK